MLLPKPENIFSEYYSSPMDKRINKKQRLCFKHLQQPSTGEFPPPLEKILEDELICHVNSKTSKSKTKVRGINRVPPLLHRRLQRECLVKRARVVLSKIEDCPNINAVWVYDRSVGKYKWDIPEDVASSEEDTELETEGLSEERSSEVHIVITEVRGNASDVFEDVSIASDSQNVVKMEYDENMEPEDNSEVMGEILEGYNPSIPDHEAPVDAKETFEQSLSYEIEPNGKVKTSSESRCEDHTLVQENICDNSLTDDEEKVKTVTGEDFSMKKNAGGSRKKGRKKKSLKKAAIKNGKSGPLYFSKAGGKRKISWRNFGFAKEKRMPRVGNHSKRFRGILKSVPPYWRSRNNFSSKKLISKVRAEEERKCLKQHLLETYRQFPEVTQEDVFHIVERNSENASPSKNSGSSKKSIKLCIKKNKCKSSKRSKEDPNSSQVNFTGSTSTKRKSDKQGKASNSAKSDDGYSLLDRELPGYNWLEKKIKSGEINTSRRASSASQDNALAVQESAEQPKDQESCNIEGKTQEFTDVQPEDNIRENVSQEEVKQVINEETQREVVASTPPETKLLPPRDQLEVTSPESGVEIDAAPQSADDSEGDFLAQGVYLVIDEGEINSGDGPYVDSAVCHLTKGNENPMEANSAKSQSILPEEISNESEARNEHDHICNNEECLLSAPERLRIANRNHISSSLDVPVSSDSILKNTLTSGMKPEEKRCEIDLAIKRSPINSISSDLPGKEAGTSPAIINLEEKNYTNKEDASFNLDPVIPVSSSSYSNIQTTAITEVKENKINMREISQVSSVHCSTDNMNSDRRVTRPSHIPVQQICKTNAAVVARKNESATQHALNSRGKFEHVPNMTPVHSGESLLVRSLQSTRGPNHAGTSVQDSSSNYAHPSQEGRANYTRRYENNVLPTSWPSLHPSQNFYASNSKSTMELLCQNAEYHPPNSSSQNEKNFTISSLLELQSASSQPQLASQTSLKTEATVSTEFRTNTVIFKNQQREAWSSVKNVVEPSSLRSQLEGNVHRQRLPEPQKLDVDEDSTDDIKIIYNNITSYKRQQITASPNTQSQATNKERGNCQPTLSQTQSPCLIYQEHIPSAIKQRTEQQIPPTSSMHPLPIMPKPIPMQTPLHPSPVLVNQVMEDIDHQRIYPAHHSDTLQPIKEHQPAQAENTSPGYQNISSYVPPKSLREEVEYRKRELVYLDQLARKREKEFERLKNIRKSKIRLLKLLENRIPIALNKECNSQKTVNYYNCAPTEKPLASEGWTCQANTQVISSEMVNNSVVQPTPVTKAPPHVSNLCSSYHYPPPNDRIKYELNNFLSSFNTHMQQKRKDTDPVPNIRKDSDVSFSKEQPLQNNSIIPPTSVSAYGMPQSAQQPGSIVARTVPVIQSKNRMMEMNPSTVMPPNHIEKGVNCQTHYPVRSIPPPAQYPTTTVSNSCQPIPVQQTYPNCQYQNSNCYEPLYPHQHVAPPARAYEQRVQDSLQPSVSNAQMEPRYKDGSMTENAQQHYCGNNVWNDHPSWPKHNIQKMPTTYPPHYQPEPKMPSTFWPVINPPVNMFNRPQRLRFPSDVVQPRTEETSVGLVFVDASKTSHQCNYCNRNAIFLCSSCKKAWYCGRECQRRNWVQHSSACVAD